MNEESEAGSGSSTNRKSFTACRLGCELTDFWISRENALDVATRS